MIFDTDTTPYYEKNVSALQVIKVYGFIAEHKSSLLQLWYFVLKIEIVYLVIGF